MKQITEDYCSFEISKLLKEKGFDGECNYYYRCHDKAIIKYFPNPGTDDNIFYCTKRWIKKHANRNHVEYILAPTHQMAMDWLRKKKHKKIIIDVASNDDNLYSLWTFNVWDGNYAIIWGEKNQPKFEKYEEAVEAALLYVLKNLI